MGRPVLASDVGGHRELIRDRVTGRLFPAGDPDALAAAIVDLFDHPEDWAALGIAGRRYVEHHRRWSASVAAYVPAYAALLGEHFDSALKVRDGMRHA
jgi:glycosyltransferase involved in cell wall biosynthesis